MYSIDVISLFSTVIGIVAGLIICVWAVKGIPFARGMRRE